jgi:hypothetical protein
MDYLADPDMIKLLAMTVAFVVGVFVCLFVVIKESIELKKRRKAKQLMYEDEVQRAFRMRKAAEQLRNSHELDALQNDREQAPQPGQQSSFRSFA